MPLGKDIQIVTTLIFSRNSNVDVDLIKHTPVSLEHERELKLSKVLLRFPEMIIKIADDLFLHPLCEFMYEVATAFTEFYDVCYCVEKDQVYFLYSRAGVSVCKIFGEKS